MGHTIPRILFKISVCLHEQFVSYNMAAVTIADDRAGNLDTSMVLNIAFFI
jgi:hypothetical protein